MVAKKKEIKSKKLYTTSPIAKIVSKKTLSSAKPSLQSVEKLLFTNPIRIQTAEGWKREQKKKYSIEKKK